MHKPQVTEVNPLGRQYVWKPIPNSLLSGVKRDSFSVTCPGLPHLLLISTAVPASLLLPLCLQSLCIVQQSGRGILESRICFCFHISVKHLILHYQYVLVSAPNLFSLFACDFTFPICFAPSRHLRQLLFSLPEFGVIVQLLLGLWKAQLGIGSHMETLFSNQHRSQCRNILQINIFHRKKKALYKKSRRYKTLLQ